MQALEVLRNGQPLVIAGAQDALLISMHVAVLVNGAHPATLHVGGMRSLGDNRQSHIRWLDELPLQEGDEMRIRLASVDEVTTPSEEVAADSDEHLAAQAEYEAQLASDPPQPSALERIRPDASLELVVGDGSPVVANFDGDRDLLMLGMSWNSWHPERWRVSLSSCSCNEALARRGAKDWVKGYVGLGEDVVVRIGK